LCIHDLCLNDFASQTKRVRLMEGHIDMDWVRILKVPDKILIVFWVS
jgi:hypothetical protein